MSNAPHTMRSLSQALGALTETIRYLSEDLATSDAENSQRRNTLALTRQEIKDLEEQLQDLHASYSFKEKEIMDLEHVLNNVIKDHEGTIAKLQEDAKAMQKKLDEKYIAYSEENRAGKVGDIGDK